MDQDFEWCRFYCVSLIRSSEQADVIHSHDPDRHYYIAIELAAFELFFAQAHKLFTPTIFIVTFIK